MSFKSLKLEFFYWRKSLFEYHAFFKYLKNKYFIAPRILKKPMIIEKPINNQNLSIHLLTCHRDLIITLWSLRSFYRVMPEIGRLYIHSDGSLDNQDKFIIAQFLPNAEIIEPSYFEKKYYHELVQSPAIKKLRLANKKNFLLKKLIDPFFISAAPLRLIIDSDLLWFNQPTAVIQAIKNNAASSLMMGNNGNCYVYFKNNERISAELASYNSGLVLYHRDNFDLAKLEEYLGRLDEGHEANCHFMEQAGYAYSLKNLTKLPESEYAIKDKLSSATIVKHYTSPRRPLFYIEGLDKIINSK